MLFNSYQFLLVFLPITLAGFVLLGRSDKPSWFLSWIIVVSIVFYGLWRPINLLIITPSVLLNYIAARMIGRLIHTHRKAALALLLLGIAGNLAFLSYFKYWNFFLGMVADVSDAHFALTSIV